MPELGRFVILGGSMSGIDLDKYIAWSEDGEDWNFVSGPGYYVENCVWSASLGLFVAVCSTGSQRLLTSPDGKVWTNRATVDDTKGWRGLCWSPDLEIFVASAYDSDVFMYSEDGINWTAGTLPANSYWSNIAWSPLLQKFIICDEYNSRVAHSVDGINWTMTTGSLMFGRGLCWSPELSTFAMTYSGKVKLSPDGITWTEHATADDVSWRDIIWSEVAGKFYVCTPASGLGGKINESVDGINWEVTTIPDDPPQRDFVRLLDAPQRDLDKLTLDFTDEAELAAVSPLINPVEYLSAHFVDEASLAVTIEVGREAIELSASFVDDATLAAVAPISVIHAPPIQTIIIALG